MKMAANLDEVKKKKKVMSKARNIFNELPHTP